MLILHIYIGKTKIVKPIFIIFLQLRANWSDFLLDFDGFPYGNPLGREIPDPDPEHGFSMGFMDLEAQKESGSPPICRKT